MRYYNPTTERWISRDPIGEQGGLNLYGFVNNNPIAAVDAIGLEILKVWAAAFILPDSIFLPYGLSPLAI
jgi:uncharacterized protein RhaS with RHS repeats